VVEEDEEAEEQILRRTRRKATTVARNAAIRIRDWRRIVCMMTAEWNE
jgi:hypothetical protein